ncbi:MAG TPA: 1-acyl-sn-glycerol-3-phosphate acyltransferase, partial [Candidatus Binatia bacterium]|nr:1-acyl-sn-glycerol-3-phosphate acyltransferase [Candidatus Binatia bacterium]
FEVQKRVQQNSARKIAEDSELPTEASLSPEEGEWLARADVQRALKVVQESARSPLPVLRPNHNLELDLGLDSMQRVELLSQLERQLGGNLEESRLADIYTVRDLVDAVLESAATGAAPASRPAFAGWSAILSEQPPAHEVLALTRPQKISTAFWSLVARVTRMIANDSFHLRVRGVEKLPPSGAYIISSNHQSYLDPVILGSVLPPEVFARVFSVGTSEIFGEGFMLRLARSLRVIVVDPDANLIPAMRAGAFGLRQGRPLILYPEGERSIDGTPRIFKKGAAILSIHVQVPIVPVAIDGFYEAWPRNHSFQKFAPLKMEFGDPIFPPPESEATEQAYDQLTSKVKSRVVEMWEGLRQAL